MNSVDFYALCMAEFILGLRVLDEGLDFCLCILAVEALFGTSQYSVNKSHCDNEQDFQSFWTLVSTTVD